MITHKRNLSKRIIGTVIDYVLYGSFFYLYVDHFGYENAEGGKTVEGLLAFPVFIVWFSYFVIVESIYGATLGHCLFYLKVVTDRYTRISITHSLKRHFLDPIDIFIFGIPGLIAINSSDKHQRLGDMWAKTFVVDGRDLLTK